jgi:hypothetical protein
MALAMSTLARHDFAAAPGSRRHKHSRRGHPRRLCPAPCMLCLGCRRHPGLRCSPAFVLLLTALSYPSPPCPAP